MADNQLNGSADRLAQAFRDVIGEAMQYRLSGYAYG